MIVIFLFWFLSLLALPALCDKMLFPLIAPVDIIFISTIQFV